MNEQTRMQRQSSIRGYIAATCVVVFWSGFNIVSRMGGKSDLTPFDQMALRFTISGLLMLPVSLRRPRAVPLRQMLTIAVLGGLLYSFAIYSGFVLAPAAHAGVLVNGGIPFATAMFAWGILGFRPNRQVVLAFSLTAIGIGLTAYQSFTVAAMSSERWWLGDVFFISAAMCWGCYGVLLRRWQLRAIDAIAALTVGSAVLYLPIYWLFLPKAISLVPINQLFLQGVYQGVIAALGAGLGYAYATQTIGPIKASLMLALVPGITGIIAVPLLGESLGGVTVIGLFCVTAGAVWGAVASAPPAAHSILKKPKATERSLADVVFRSTGNPD